MKDKSFTEEQSKAMVVCFCALLTLAIPTSLTISINRIFGIFMAAFASIMSYREIINNGSSNLQEKIISLIIIIVFMSIGVILLINNKIGENIICAIGGLLMIIIGILDLITAKEKTIIYISLAFAIIGTIVLFFPCKITASIIHLCGIFLCYYELKSFLMDKLG